MGQKNDKIQKVLGEAVNNYGTGAPLPPPGVFRDVDSLSQKVSLEQLTGLHTGRVKIIRVKPGAGLLFTMQELSKFFNIPLMHVSMGALHTPDEWYHVLEQIGNMQMGSLIILDDFERITQHVSHAYDELELPHQHFYIKVLRT